MRDYCRSEGSKRQRALPAEVSAATRRRALAARVKFFPEEDGKSFTNRRETGKIVAYATEIKEVSL